MHGAVGESQFPSSFSSKDVAISSVGRFQANSEVIHLSKRKLHSRMAFSPTCAKPSSRAPAVVITRCGIVFCSPTQSVPNGITRRTPERVAGVKAPITPNP